jgi:hypothetical protein
MTAVDKIVEWTGWGWTDCQAAMHCPKCKAPAGEPCRTPKGRKAWPPHIERSLALNQTGYSANRRPAIGGPLCGV